MSPVYSDVVCRSVIFHEIPISAVARMNITTIAPNITICSIRCRCTRICTQIKNNIACIPVSNSGGKMTHSVSQMTRLAIEERFNLLYYEEFWARKMGITGTYHDTKQNRGQEFFRELQRKSWLSSFHRCLWNLQVPRRFRQLTANWLLKNLKIQRDQSSKQYNHPESWHGM